MNQEQRRKLYIQGFNDGVDSTQDYLVKALYGAAALAAHREFKFGSARCLKLLNAMDKLIMEYFTSQEIIDKAWEEVGLRIRFRDAIEPFEEVKQDGSAYFENGNTQPMR